MNSIGVERCFIFLVDAECRSGVHWSLVAQHTKSAIEFFDRNDPLKFRICQLICKPIGLLNFLATFKMKNHIFVPISVHICSFVFQFHCVFWHKQSSTKDLFAKNISQKWKTSTCHNWKNIFAREKHIVFFLTGTKTILLAN